MAQRRKYKFNWLDYLYYMGGELRSYTMAESF